MVHTTYIVIKWRPVRIQMAKLVIGQNIILVRLLISQIFRDNVQFHRKSTKKSPAAQSVVDHGEGSTKHPRHHAIILDKGYVGIEDSVR